ncbi:hypothetical protein FI667_g10954, partial [Globisporangium splendens]
MSGRAYARNAQGHLGGGADLESIVPHRFTLATPKCLNSAKELAIRRVIRRRCTEKNWKKLISRRRVRLEGEAAVAETATPNSENGGDQSNTTDGSEQQAVTNADADDKSDDKKTESEPKADAKTVSDAPSANGSARKTKTGNPPDNETMVLAKRQLEELEARLQTLVEQKHAKFVELKHILVEEARSKSSGSALPPQPTAAASAVSSAVTTPAVQQATAVAASKKRRVEFKEPSASSTMSPRSSGTESVAAGSSGLVAAAGGAAPTTASPAPKAPKHE